MRIAARTSAGRIGLISALVAVACGRGAEKAATAAAGAGVVSRAAADSARDVGPIMAGDHAIIRSGAVGPLRIGDWRRAVMSLVYVVSARSGPDSAAIIVARGIGKDTVTLAFRNDTLRGIIVTRPGPHTSVGIGLGTPFAAVAAQPGASVTKRGVARSATVPDLCGVTFATDSTALTLTEDTAPRHARGDSLVRAISVGDCKH
jgi:hypothetical protein